MITARCALKTVTPIARLGGSLSQGRMGFLRRKSPQYPYPAMVSSWTGSKEVVAQVDENLIVPLDIQISAKQMIWYFNLSVEEKKRDILPSKRSFKPLYRE